MPNLLLDPVWSGLDNDKRACYDDDRIDHQSRLLVVQTPTIRQVITSGRWLAYLSDVDRLPNTGQGVRA